VNEKIEGFNSLGTSLFKKISPRKICETHSRLISLILGWGILN